MPSKDKKNILVITTRFPYPPIGGDRLRIYNICKNLSKDFNLTLLSLYENKAELLVEPTDIVFNKIYRIYLPLWRSLLNAAINIFSSKPLQISYYKSSELQKMAELLIPDHDMVLTHLIRAAEFGRSTHKINILEMTDAISLNYSRITSQKISFFDLRAFIYRIELSRLKRYEKSIVKDFNLSVLISEVDKRYLFGNNSNQNNLLVISNGVDASHFKFSFNPALGDIAFIGNMKSYQNYHAASYMATEILPIIRISFPDVRLRLIGRISLKAMEYFIKLDGVDITGEVRDINDAVIGCSVGVCPVTIGAGVQNKILEYMALGLPVVTTSVGAEGLNIASGAECLIANDPISFANAVINLLSDRKIAESLSLQGRTYIEKYHSWDYILNKYNNSVMTVFNDLEA